MNELTGLMKIAQSVGIPALFAVVLLGLGMKYIPKFLDAWLLSRHELGEQATRVIEVAARGEIALRQSSEVIERSAAAAERMIAAFDNIGVSMSALAGSLNEHDRRAEEMNVGIHQILENSRL
ncbi:MAG: hypothetical protein LBN00_11190 [Oscillospiraceae bacterium]|jgi:hypothetical protein|nr:hypothetical protein [Oscillospiraceae bacterium]